MFIPNRVSEAVSARARRWLPKAAFQPPKLDFAPYRKRARDDRKFSTRTSFLSLGGARATETEMERLIGTNDLVDEFYLERALLAAGPVARISLRTPAGSERGPATGFMVSPRLLLTNEHVFTSAVEAEPSVVDFNYRYDIAGNPEPFYRFKLRPDLFFFADEELDFALVSVESSAIDGTTPLAAFGYHRLIAQSGKALVKEWMAIIQHPGGARRQFALRENQCIQDQDPDVIWYTSDTAPGSSGSPVLNDSFQVVALHHAGVPQRTKDGRVLLKNGRTVKSTDDADDSEVVWVANAGIRISRICTRIKEAAPEMNGHLAELQAAMSGDEDLLSRAYQHPDSNHQLPNPMNPLSNPNLSSGSRLVLGTLVLEFNAGAVTSALSLKTIAGAQVPQPLTDEGGGGTGELNYKKPIIDDSYDSRTGFDTNFLGIKTPLLKITDAKIVSPLKKGGKQIRYEHFSVFLHKDRKMPIYTATNVDGSPAAKEPEAGHKYTRKELTGITEKFTAEAWVMDPRVDAKYQIPDAFYNKDKGNFQKGHVTRREDVCFGTSFKQVQRANGDTFHLTNCTPQRENFNESGEKGIWGQLEDFIAAQADTEKYCIFAGPVLSDEDKTFMGTEPVKIPSRFWKVVCAQKNGKLQAFAFMLEQVLPATVFEFQLDAKWKKKMVSLKTLEKEVKLVKFPTIYHDADQGK